MATKTSNPVIEIVNHDEEDIGLFSGFVIGHRYVGECCQRRQEKETRDSAHGDVHQGSFRDGMAW
jgi:hypothetical protein